MTFELSLKFSFDLFSMFIHLKILFLMFFLKISAKSNTEYSVRVVPLARNTEYSVRVVPLTRNTEYSVRVVPLARNTEYSVTVVVAFQKRLNFFEWFSASTEQFSKNPFNSTQTQITEH